MLLADVQQGPGLFSAVRVLHTIASSSLMPVSFVRLVRTLPFRRRLHAAASGSIWHLKGFLDSEAVKIHPARLRHLRLLF